jgi:predicted Zn-dependent protease
MVALAGGWRYRVTRPDYRLNRGEEAVRERDWVTAKELADTLEGTGYPDRAYWLRAQLFYARRQPQAALAECDRVRDEGALGISATLLAGKCLLDLEELIEAKRRFLIVIKAQPDNVDARRGLAVIAYDLGQYSEAVEQIEHVIRLEPEDARPHRFMGEIYRDSADTEKAVAEFQQALHLKNGLSDVALAQVRFEIAEGLLRLFRYAEALAILDEAVADGQPEPLYMQAIRADSLRGLGKRDDAIALVDRLLMTDKPEPFFLQLRAQLYVDVGNSEAAVPLLERATQLTPRHHQSHVLLAQAYAAVGRKADADSMRARAEVIKKEYDLLSDMSREASANPWDPFVRIRLAEYYQRTGDAKAAASWRRAAEACMSVKR